MDAAIPTRQHLDRLYRRAGGIDPPADVILSWPAPNYISPETHSNAGPIAAIVLCVLSVLVYIARMWARIVVSKNVGLDDWIMTAAILPLIATIVAVVLACTKYGFQWHAWDQTSETYVTTRKSILAIEFTYLTTNALVKISILCFYKRMTNGAITKWVYWIWGSIAFVIAYYFAFVFAMVFSCSPVEGYWHYFDISWRLTHELKCHNEGALIAAFVVVNTLQDFFLCALPVLLIWSLKMPKRQKFALCGIFGLGLLTCVCGVLRAYYATYTYYATYDITWYAWYGWIWTTFESEFGVMCACAPALKCFFKEYFNLSTRSDADAYEYGSGKLDSSGKRIPGYGKLSPGNSLATEYEPDPVPMNRIKVSTTTDIIADPETASQGSTSSTRKLTVTPSRFDFPPSAHRKDQRESAPSIWDGNRTVVTTYGIAGNFDIEHGARSP